jgi:hypothetical protein
VLEFCNDRPETLLALAQGHGALFNALFQIAAEPSVSFEGQPQHSNQDHVEKCLKDKHQQFHDVCRAFNEERPAWWQQEERGRSSAEDNTRKAGTQSAD